jgi:PIN domain nuclease of toxin-antitoxin system
VILLDTHVWLWWLSDPSRRSRPAAERIDADRESGAVAACERRTFFRFAIAAGIAVASVELDGLHPDPADRLIVATARHEGLDLVTPDERLHAWPGATTLG